jgi:hypothetical protein
MKLIYLMSQIFKYDKNKNNAPIINLGAKTSYLNVLFA